MEPFRQPYRGGSAEPNNHDHGHGHEYSQDHHEQSKSLLNTQPSLFMPPPTTTTTTVGSQAYRDQVNRRSLLSPPSSTKSPPRSSTPTKDHPLVYRTRLIVRILSFILSAALVVVLSHAVSVYYSSKDADAFDISLQLTLPVWPRDMKMNPTLLLLGAASVATLLSGIICIASFSKVIRRLTPTSTAISLAVSLIATPLWIAVAVYYKVDDLDPTKQWDLLSFTCGRRHDSALDRAIGNLGSLCLQMRYAWWGALAIGVLEVLTLVMGVFIWWAGRKRGMTSTSIGKKGGKGFNKAGNRTGGGYEQLKMET